jgi:hypothetical protein
MELPHSQTAESVPSEEECCFLFVFDPQLLVGAQVEEDQLGGLI